MTVYAAPGAPGAKIAFKPRYDNFIGGRFVAPADGQYFDVISPINGKVIDGLDMGGGFAHTPAAYGNRAFLFTSSGRFLGLHIAPPMPLEKN